MRKDKKTGETEGKGKKYADMPTHTYRESGVGLILSREWIKAGA